MNPQQQEMQDAYPDMNVDDAAAALGFSTTLSDTMLQPMLDAQNMPVEDAADPEGQEDVQMEAAETPPVDPENAPHEEKMGNDDADIKSFKKEVTQMIDDRMSEIKELIANALTEDDEDDESEE